MHKNLITKIIIFSVFFNYTLEANSGSITGIVISNELEPNECYTSNFFLSNQKPKERNYF